MASQPLALTKLVPVAAIPNVYVWYEKYTGCLTSYTRNFEAKFNCLTVTATSIHTFCSFSVIYLEPPDFAPLFFSVFAGNVMRIILALRRQQKADKMHVLKTDQESNNTEVTWNLTSLSANSQHTILDVK